MNQQLNEYFLRKEEERQRALEAKKHQLLYNQGIFEKVYSESEDDNPEYPKQEWDSATGKYRRYKVVTPQISDEEYARLKELSKSSKGTQETNTVAVILNVIAWLIFIVGFFAGIVVACETKESYFSDEKTDFNFVVALSYWAVSFISCIFFIALGEIIKLLDEIRKK